MFRLSHASTRPVTLASLVLAALALPGLSLAQAKRDLSKGNTLYVVPYAHLDTQWRWAYPQTIREYLYNTLHDNFRLLDKYPNYVFNFSGSRRYEMMKEYYPAEYERMKGYIKQGRWFPCGSSVDEADANVPSGESLLRQVLYGNRYFQKEFGVVSHEFMLPDCFGFPYALPSILNHCGIKGFSTQKLTWGSANGIPFKVGRWYGPDGKMVVSALDPGAYAGDVTEDLSQNTSWLARIQNTGKISGAYVDYHYYGTGDIGGAPKESSVNWVERSVNGSGPVDVVSTRADEMFLSLLPSQIEKLPTYNGELLLTEHSAGSVTSQAYMKRWNRKSELMADAAERASVAAMWLGGAAYPSDRLYQAWDLVLGTQMHDMLPGTSVPKAYEFCWNDYLLAQNMYASVTQDAVGAVTSAMDTRAKGRPLAVYNPLSISREDIVEMTVQGLSHSPLQVYGPDGKPVPTQVLGRTATATRIAFRAKVPANSFTVFDLRRGNFAARDEMRVSTNNLENGRFRVRISDGGDIVSIYDKAYRREVLKAPIKLAFQYHNPAQFPAWNMDWSDAKLPPRAHVGGAARIQVVEDGPVRVAVQVERQSEGSRFVQTVRLSSGSAGDRVEVSNTIDWNTRESALKASFPLATGNAKATYDLQLGTIQRGNNDPKKYEVPQHQWMDLTSPDGKYGVAILNDGKFGSDKPDDDTLRLTLLYTPGVRGGYRDQATQDFGRHETLYAIAPHVGDWRQGNVTWAARRMNQPLQAFWVPAHPGKLGKSFSLISSSSKQVEIAALKKAEDNNEVIVRLRELEGRPASGVQIRTAAGIVSAREMDGQEHPIGAATVRNGALVANVPAYSLKTYALRFAAPKVQAVSTKSQPIPLPYNADVASTDRNRADGAFDSAGRSYAAEQMPSSLTVDGVRFNLGPTRDGAKNAVISRGQEISLPAGTRRIHILAASNAGDVRATFGIEGGGTRRTGNAVSMMSWKGMAQTTIQDWGGYVGQWDNRLWEGDLGPNYTNYGPWAGLEPGYIKPAEVAWYSSHRHHPARGNEHYMYSYMFKHDIDVTPGTSRLVLPNDPRVRIFAVSVSTQAHETAKPATALMDTFEDRNAGNVPRMLPTTGNGRDATEVTLTPPLYWRASGLRYTLDGSTPTANSPVYKGPFTVTDPTTVRFAEVDASGKVGPVVTEKLNVRDVTAPRIVAATSPRSLGYVRVRFSEAVDPAAARTATNYQISPPTPISGVRLLPDQRTVELTLAEPIPAGSLASVRADGIADLSNSRNVARGVSLPIEGKGPVFTSPELAPKTSRNFPTPGLPARARDPWTLNFLTKVDAKPEPRTIIAGFGRATDGRGGAGRYFTWFDRGINFWVTQRDVMTSVPLDLGKWQMLTATYDGKRIRLYKNGEPIAEREVELADDQAIVRVMPPDAWERRRVFQGEVRDMTVWDEDLSPAAIRLLWETLRGK